MSTFARPLALLLAVLASLAVATPAVAGGDTVRYHDRGTPSATSLLACGRFGSEHYFYRGGTPDPFAYCYRQRGYYPYYNSGYWRSRRHVEWNRARFHHPRYDKAWGIDRRHPATAVRRWTRDHHGAH